MHVPRHAYLRERGRTPAECYAVVVVTITLAALLRWFLSPLTGDSAVFLPFAPAVMTSAWYGGWRSGLAATLLGALTANFLWQEPSYSLALHSVAEGVNLGLFLVVGLLISGLNEALHRARWLAVQNARALADTENRYRMLIEGVRDYAIVMLDPHGSVVSWNAGAESIYGFRPNEIIGRHYCRFFTADDLRRRLPEQALEAAATWGRLHLEGWRVRRDGSHFWVSAVLTTVRDDAGRLRGFSMVGQNSTDSKMHLDELLQSQRQLRDLSAHLQAVREHERMRIAREIHDELGQALTCLKLEVSWLRGRFREDQGALAEKVHGICELINDAVRSTRRIATELRPRVLDHFGLAAAIEWQAQEFETRSGIRCALASPLPEVSLDPERSTALFRIFQEALTNVARHAGATQVRIALEAADDALVLEVQDNGRGISPAEAQGTRSLGLLGMRERALMFGGRVVIAGIRGEGTHVTIWMPHEKGAGGWKS